MNKAPHVIPYQGSKRKLASSILSYVNFNVDTLFEPFVGSGAITLAMAANGMANKYVVADKFEALAELWRMMVFSPDLLIEEYTSLWNSQLTDPALFFNKTRDDFNTTKSPSALLYLIARCVKNAIRFNSNGDFNQGADHRRLGLKPEKLKKEVLRVSDLLRGVVDVHSCDFRESILNATENDLIYMDPPWQGTSGKKDPRYAHLLNIDELIAELQSLNTRNVPYMLSFDGSCGDKSYGKELPNFLDLHKVQLNAGISSQAILLGRNDVTIESLYLSPAFMHKARESVSTSLGCLSEKLSLDMIA